MVPVSSAGGSDRTADFVYLRNLMNPELNTLSVALSNIDRYPDDIQVHLNHLFWDVQAAIGMINHFHSTLPESFPSDSLSPEKKALPPANV